MAAIADLVKQGMQAEASHTGDKALAHEADGNSNLERLMKQVAEEEDLDFEHTDELAALQSLWDQEKAASKHGQSERSIMEDFDAYARDLGRATGIGPEEAYLGMHDSNNSSSYDAAPPSAMKRGPGRPRKSAPTTPAHENSWAPPSSRQGEQAEPPKLTAAEERAKKEQVQRRKYIKKLEYAWRVETWRARLERVVKPPKNDDWNTLTYAQAEAAYEAVCAELDDVDPEPWITSMLTRGAFVLENIAPVVGGFTGLDASMTNLSHPISLGSTVAQGTKDTNSPMADAIRRLTLVYVGEWQSGPITTAVLGMVQVVAAVAAANGALAQRSDSGEATAAAAPVPDYSSVLEEQGLGQTAADPVLVPDQEPEPEKSGKKRGRPRKKAE